MLQLEGESQHSEDHCGGSFDGLHQLIEIRRMQGLTDVFSLLNLFRERESSLGFDVREVSSVVMFIPEQDRAPDRRKA